MSFSHNLKYDPLPADPFAVGQIAHLSVVQVGGCCMMIFSQHLVRDLALA